jgi:Undecaprenyl-phosphate galactose phosphotransferase WbaP
MVIDGIAVMLCFGASFFIVNLIDHTVIDFRSFVTYWVYLPAILAVFYAVKLYPGLMLAPGDELYRFTLCSAAGFTGIAISIAVETENRDAIGVAMILAIPIASMLLPLGREIGRRFFAHFPWWGVPAIIYYKNREGDQIVNRLLKHPEFGYRPVLILNTGDEAPADYQDIPVTRPDEKIHEIIRSLRIKTAILVESRDDPISNKPLGDTIMNLYRYTVLIPYTQNISTVSISIRDFGGILGFASTHNLTRRGNIFLKRCTDIVLVLISSPLVLPITAVVAMLVKLTSPGPVFYGHVRSGKNGKLFRTWKFRTMVLNAEKKLKEILNNDPQARKEWEENQKLENDPRITPLGKFLRKTSLDEIPQLWNIFTGQMSLVGPRPVTEGELEKYGDKAKYILAVTPGLSGMWQISGRSGTGYEQRIMLDTYYIQNWSIWLDGWILIKTIGVVLNTKGAY